jgi:hypothetical protein
MKLTTDYQPMQKVIVSGDDSFGGRRWFFDTDIEMFLFTAKSRKAMSPPPQFPL